jgi:hypothetical protein
MAAELLDGVLEAHGGAERFAAAREIAIDVRSWGALFLLKRQHPRIAPFECRIQTATPHAVFAPYPKPGQRGVFSGDAVRIETDDGELLCERRNPRAAFSRPRRIVRWDDLDLCYFAGYAWWNYLTTPFLLARPGFELAEIEPMTFRGERLRRLHVRFPAEVPTHCPEQVFGFTEDGLLRRHDYTAEVIGSFAKGSHLTANHIRSGGLSFPTHRRVKPRGPRGAVLPGPTIVGLDVTDVRVT